MTAIFLFQITSLYYSNKYVYFKATKINFTLETYLPLMHTIDLRGSSVFFPLPQI